MEDIELKTEQLLLKAIKMKASDIHVVPRNIGSAVQFRIAGTLINKTSLSSNEAEKMISHLKFRSKMDIGERRRPQNGSVNLIVDNEKINLRLSTLPTASHESLAIRLLPQNEVSSLEQLSLFPSQTKKLQKLIKRAYGLILFSGPTGSGKTTTIYSLLHQLATDNKRIISIEDPIEKMSEMFIQVEINEKAQVTFAEALKASLRHDPDIIMIGEIRDEETAKIAVRAAMTGHLVISTVHAKDTKGTIMRMRELGITSHELNETLVAIVSQRLVKTMCPICGVNCSSICLQRRYSRLAIYEILTGNALENQLTKCSCNVHFTTINQLLSKAMALGYINHSECERWLC